MAFRFNPRGDLPPPTIQPAYIHRRASLLTNNSRHNNKRLSSLSLSSKPRVKPCYDWIFSSATNVHIALDRSAFKEYIAFDSYVLTLSHDQQVYVRGVGTVELKIKRKPDSRETHTILLTDVLHIPAWMCNIFSDAYFSSGHDFEHSWTDFGVQFSKQEEKELKAWGYTENFCSLDRLVLAKRHKDSRSPMLDDKDREVFSINVRWPQSQRDRWGSFLINGQANNPFRPLSEPVSLNVKTIAEQEVKLDGGCPKVGTVSRRATLSDVSANIVKRAPSKRVSSLKATISGKDLSNDLA